MANLGTASILINAKVDQARKQLALVLADARNISSKAFKLNFNLNDVEKALTTQTKLNKLTRKSVNELTGEYRNLYRPAKDSIEALKVPSTVLNNQRTLKNAVKETRVELQKGKIAAIQYKNELERTRNFNSSVQTLSYSASVGSPGIPAAPTNVQQNAGSILNSALPLALASANASGISNTSKEVSELKSSIDALPEAVRKVMDNAKRNNVPVGRFKEARQEQEYFDFKARSVDQKIEDSYARINDKLNKRVALENEIKTLETKARRPTDKEYEERFKKSGELQALNKQIEEFKKLSKQQKLELIDQDSIDRLEKDLEGIKSQLVEIDKLGKPTQLSAADQKKRKELLQVQKDINKQIKELRTKPETEQAKFISASKELQKEINAFDRKKKPLTPDESFKLEQAKINIRALDKEIEKAIKSTDKLGKEQQEYNKRLKEMPRSASFSLFRAPGLPPKPPRNNPPGGGSGGYNKGGSRGRSGISLNSDVLVGFGSAAIIRNVTKGALALEQAELRLRSLSREFGEFDRIQQLVSKNADIFNLSQREATQTFADVYARLRPMGKSLDEIQTIFKGFNAVAIANGASAADASGAFLQLSQSLGAGTLQGDEFRSITERLPGILSLVADELGVAVGDLKQLGSEGKLTADVLINSLAKGFELNKDKIKKLLNESSTAKFKAFNNAVTNLGDSVGKKLLPAITPLVEGLTAVVDGVDRLPGPIKAATGAVVGLGLAASATAGALKLLGVSVTTAGAVGFGKFAAIAAAILQPLVGIAVAMEDVKKEKERLDGVLGNGSLNELNEEIETQVQKLTALVRAYEGLDREDPFFDQYGDVQRLRGEIEEVEKLVQELTKRRQLILDLKINVPFPDFDKMGPGFSKKLEKELEKLGYDYTPGEEVNKGTETDLIKNQIQAAQQLAQEQRNQHLETANLERDLQEANIEALGRLRELQAAKETQSLISNINNYKSAVSDMFDRQRDYLNDVVEAEIRLTEARERLQLAQPGEDMISAQSDVDLASADLKGKQDRLNLFDNAIPSILDNAMQESQLKASESYRDLTDSIEDQITALQTRNRLIMEGFTGPALQGAIKQAELQRQFNSDVEAIQSLNLNPEEATSRIQNLTAAYNEAKASVEALTGAQVQQSSALIQAYAQSQEYISDVQARIVDITTSIETSVSSAFTDFIAETKNLSTAFRDLFEDIGKSFFQMAQKIIAQMVKMLIFKTLLNIFGGGGSFAGGASFGEGVAMPGVGMGAGGGILQNPAGQGFGTFGPNFGFRQFAKGGIVTSPTHALIGEAGMNEAVVPLPNGKAIPVDFGKGAKMGGDVTSTVTVNIDNSGGSSTEMSGNEAGKLGKAIDVAVKRVIMEEKRAGGLLHNGRR